MRVTLRLSDGLDSDQGLLKVVDLSDRPFVVGRSPEADWTVLDPSSRVSGTHLELRRHGEDLLLVDRSSGGTGLGTAANRLQHGQPTRLPDECKLVLPVGAVSVSVERADAGARRLEAEEDDDFFRIGEIKRERGLRGPSFPGVNPSELLGEPVADDPLRARQPVFDDTLAAPSSPAPSGDSASKLLNPGDLLGGGGASIPAPAAGPLPRPEPQRPEPQRPEPHRPEPQRPEPQRPAPSAFDLEEPSAPPPPMPQPARAAPAAKSGGSWLDDDDEDDNPFDAPPAAEPEVAFAPPPVAPPPDSPPLASEPETGPAQPVAPDADLLESGEDLSAVHPPLAPPPSAADLSPDVPEPRPVPDPKPVPDPEPVPAHAPEPASAADREALDAIFTQLGIPTDISDAARLRMAMEIGVTFAAMADAMRQMLATRAEVKRALGIVATEIEIGANPLKTARDRTAAVDGLVRPLSSGFLSGEAAVEDSLHSMQSHQYAMVTGIKAALQKTLDAFDPAALEEKMTKRGLTSWLPGQHKAALWDSFVTNYEMFSEQAAENFRMLIGRELDNLYQTRRDQTPGRQSDR